ncbi:MAG: hypothetical protein QOJ80_2816 [Mycobacterium sp.]|jgi:uncharacterized membrane protein HdeD (DUF308 family)|nr:hypothetical protein [Mycobacterium sp.]
MATGAQRNPHTDSVLCNTSDMTTSAPPSMLPHLWKSAIVSGVLAAALGVAVLVWTGTSITLAAIFFGVALLVTGFEQLFFAFSLRTSTALRVLLLLSGAAALVLAIIALAQFYDAWRLLAIWIAVGFIFRGVSTTISAISDPTLPGRFWNIVMGVLSLIAGVVIMAAPYPSLHILALFVGYSLIVLGVFEVVTGFMIRRATKATPVAAPEQATP